MRTPRGHRWQIARLLAAPAVATVDAVAAAFRLIIVCHFSG